MNTRVFRIGFYLVLPVMILLPAGCRNTASQITVNDHSGTSQAAQEISLTIPTDTSDVAFKGLKQTGSVSKYYRIYGSGPVWMGEDGYTGHADSMLSVIRNAQYFGIPGSLYHLRELEVLIHNAVPARSIRVELLLTDAFLSLAGDLKYGVLNTPEKREEDTLRIQLLNQVVAGGSLLATLESQEPALNGYRDLRKGLRLLLDSIPASDADSTAFSAKVRLVSINMERWRRETDYGKRYIFINIPSYMLEVIDRDSVVLSSRTIVGAPKTETPVLSSVVECFSIYPYWHVPRKIAVQEYLPILKKDTTFLRRNNFDVLDRKGNILNADSVPWNKFTNNYFPVVLRQREGIENSLGVIKFVFDNPYAVFLHDTNAKRLFRSSMRALSHGCIRMERAVDLAHYFVTGSTQMESKTISKYLKEKQQRWIYLKDPIAIYTRYFTCDFRDGVINAYQDVYGKDQQLYELLYNHQTQLDL